MWRYWPSMGVTNFCCSILETFLKVPLTSTTSCSTLWIYYCAVRHSNAFFECSCSDTCYYMEQVAMDYFITFVRWESRVPRLCNSEMIKGIHSSQHSFSKVTFFFHPSFWETFEPTCHLGSNLLCVFLLCVKPVHISSATCCNGLLTLKRHS